MISRLLSIFFFLSNLSFCLAQKDTLNLFYQENSKLLISKFEREHIPLDGKKAKLIPKRIDELYGFVSPDKPNEWLIFPEYDEVFAIYENIAMVKKGHGYCFINSKNKKFIPCSYDNIFMERENIIRATSDGIRDSIYSHLPEYYQSTFINTYMDNLGNFLFNEFCHDFRGFNQVDTLAWFRKGKTFTIRGISGKVHKQIAYNKNRLFKGISDNKLIYQERFNNDYMYTAYDVNDNIAFKLPLNYGYVESLHKLSDDFFGIYNYGTDYSFCNKKGEHLPYKMVFTEHYSVLQPSNPFYTQSVFIVQHKETKLFGLLNVNGALLGECNFKYIEQFVNDEAFAIDNDDNPVVIDKKGDIVSKLNINSPFLLLREFSILAEPYGFYDELAIGKKAKLFEEERDGEIIKFAIQDSNLHYYYDKKGKTILELPSSISFAGNFSEGLAPVVTNKGKLGFIDKSGRWVIPPKYEAQLAGGYPMPYLVLPKFINGFAYIKAFKGYIDKKGDEYFSGKQMKDKYNFSH